MLDSLFLHPQGMAVLNGVSDGTMLDMGSRKDADAHEKLVDDFTPGKAEGLLEELCPFR